MMEQNNSARWSGTPFHPLNAESGMCEATYGALEPNVGFCRPAQLKAIIDRVRTILFSSNCAKLGSAEPGCSKGLCRSEPILASGAWVGGKRIEHKHFHALERVPEPGWLCSTPNALLSVPAFDLL